MESLMIEMKSISLYLFPKNKLRRKITLMKLALTVLSCTPATFGCLADGIIFHETFESPNSVCFSGDGTIDTADGYKTPGALLGTRKKQRRLLKSDRKSSQNR